MVEAGESNPTPKSEVVILQKAAQKQNTLDIYPSKSSDFLEKSAPTQLTCFWATREVCVGRVSLDSSTAGAQISTRVPKQIL